MAGLVGTQVEEMKLNEICGDQYVLAGVVGTQVEDRQPDEKFSCGVGNVFLRWPT